MKIAGITVVISIHPDEIMNQQLKSNLQTQAAMLTELRQLLSRIASWNFN